MDEYTETDNVFHFLENVAGKLCLTKYTKMLNPPPGAEYAVKVRTVKHKKWKDGIPTEVCSIFGVKLPSEVREIYHETRGKIAHEMWEAPNGFQIVMKGGAGYDSRDSKLPELKMSFAQWEGKKMEKIDLPVHPAPAAHEVRPDDTKPPADQQPVKGSRPRHKNVVSINRKKAAAKKKEARGKKPNKPKRGGVKPSPKKPTVRKPVKKGKK